MPLVKYVVVSEEPLWFLIGLIAGAVFMALVDFMIDRSKRNAVIIRRNNSRECGKVCEKRASGCLESGAEAS